MTESVQFASMNCPGCGAGLQVTSAMDFFACGYCGMSIRAVRQGGTVALIAEALARIQTGTDKTAAELALIRLKDELKTINLAVEQLKLAEPQVFIPEENPLWSLHDTARLIWLVIWFLVGLVVFFVSGLLDKDLWALWALIISFLALFSYFRQSHREKLEKRNAFNRDSANNAMRGFEREMEDLAAKQKSIEMQIEKNIAFVNSPGS